MKHKPNTIFSLFRESFDFFFPFHKELNVVISYFDCLEAVYSLPVF